LERGSLLGAIVTSIFGKASNESTNKPQHTKMPIPESYSSNNEGNFILSLNLMSLNADTKCDRKNSEWGFLMSGFVAFIFGKTPDESTQTPKDIEMGIPQPYASDNQTDEPSVEDMKPIPPGDIGSQRSAELSTYPALSDDLCAIEVNMFFKLCHVNS